MIVFSGTKSIGIRSFMIFENENGAKIDIPVDEKTLSMFLHYFHRLSPGNVEKSARDSSEVE